MFKWVVVGIAIVVVVGFLIGYAAGLWQRSRPWSGVITYDTKVDNAVHDDRGQAIQVISYNMAYGRGRRDDKGDLRTKHEIVSHLTQIAEKIKHLNPDLLFIQEIDLYSQRSHYIDEVAWLGGALNFPYVAYVITWDKRYVPYPFWDVTNHYGRVVSGQAVFSKFPIVGNTRVPLPQPRENWALYNLFYLTRCLQVVQLDVGGDLWFAINVHLEAFNVANRMKQARIVADWVNRLAPYPIIMAGDFNALPSGERKVNGYLDEPEIDFSNDDTMLFLSTRPALSEVISHSEYVSTKSQYYTFPGDVPARRLDYIFHTAHFKRLAGAIRHEFGPLSDHLPVWAELVPVQSMP